MTSSSAPKLRPVSANDIVGDRHSLVVIGMLAVWIACVVFGAARLVVTLSTGKLTPWWVNVAGAIAISALYLWYRRRPQRRSPGAANGTALVATVALLVPVSYGMSSTMWWLGLVGFAMVLLGRRREAWVWGVTIPLLVVAAGFLEPLVQLQGAAGEPPVERGLARVIFVILLVGMAAAFRGVAEQRARALHDSDERYRMLFQRAPVGVFHCDDTLRITDCNERFADIVGSSRESLIGFDMTSLTDRRVLPAIHEALQGAQSTYDGPYRGPVGRTERFVSIRTVPLNRKDGSVVGALGIVEDVTERQRMERELLRSHDELEQRVRERTAELRQSRGVVANILNSIPQGVFWKDANGVYLGCNQVFARAAGLVDPEDIVGKNDVELPWRDQAEVFRADDRKVIESGRPKRGIIVSIEQADGRRPWVSTTKVPLTDETGAAFGVLGVTEDITERKRTEEALRESEERYRSLFEQSPIGIYRTTPDGHILLANPALLNMLGYDRLEDLVARNLETIGFEPDYPRQRFKELLERDNEIRGFEAVWTKKSGRTVRVIENARAIRGADGKILYYEGAVEDITARMAAEAAQRRLAAAVEQGDEAVVITDPNGVIEYVNPAFERITGYRGDEAIGQTPRLLKSGSHDAAFYKTMWDTIRGGEVWTGHLINRRKGGSTYEEETTISPVRDASGKIVNYVAVKRDVTREVALQQQLNQAQKMQAIGRLAGGIAHDFNNVLQALLTHAQLLRAHADDAEHVRNEATEFEQQVLRGATLTRQLLLFSRRETARPERLDLNDVARNAAGMLRRLVRENVAFDLELADRPAMVEADRGQLDQVLMNLVVNASDAMEEGGRLVIRTGYDLPESSWLEVEDTGHGIPEAIRQQVFEPFFTTKDPGKGTGLGLSLVHGIVTQHRGRLELDTREGQGSRFRVVLPRAGSGEFAPVPEAATVPTDLPLGSGERVLVVEDEEGAREGLREILVSLGYEVVAAGSGAEAGRLAAEPGFALLLTDLMLPDVAGHELAAGLQARWPGLAVVLMSGYAEHEAVRRGIEAGRVQFLQKPFDMQTLASAVRRALDDPDRRAADSGRR